jgi:hypothetical protein
MTKQIDSNCRECFVSAATALSNSELEREERKHRCDSWLIERVLETPAQ